MHLYPFMIGLALGSGVVYLLKKSKSKNTKEN